MRDPKGVFTYKKPLKYVKADCYLHKQPTFNADHGRETSVSHENRIYSSAALPYAHITTPQAKTAPTGNSVRTDAYRTGGSRNNLSGNGSSRKVVITRGNG